MTALLVALLCFVMSMEYSCQIVPGVNELALKDY